MTPPEEKTRKRDIRDLVNQSQSLRANFVVQAGEDIGRRFEIDHEPLLIGRKEGCDIFVNDEDVSREHARVVVADNTIMVEDLGSTNGTLVNGEPVNRRVLQDGDRIQVGNITILKFNISDDIEDTFTEKLYTAANKDFLTQIYNRKYFLDRLKMEFSYSRRHEVPLSLIIFDLDRFKQVNDNYGHAAGDFVLKELAAQIGAIKREEDVFARFGGEEFVLLLRATHEESCRQIAEKVRSRVDEIAFPWEGQSLSISTSVGLATFEDQNYRTYEDLLRAADGAMYAAKAQGGNTVVCADGKKKC